MQHILFIDDDYASLTVFQELCRHAQIVATIASTPIQVEEALANVIKFDMVVTDLEMPKITGYVIHQRIRESKKYNHVPVVACSAYTGQLTKARDLGFNGFIAKPIDPDTFIATLQNISQGNQFWDLNTR